MPKPTSKERSALSRWAQALDDRRLARRKTLTQISLDQLARWRRGESFPRAETLTSLVPETLALKIWDDVGEVIDWLTLLNVPGQAALRLLYTGLAGARSAEEIQADIETASRQNRWWRPLRNLPVEDPGYIPRMIEPHLKQALFNLTDFQRPGKRVSAISAPAGSGKTTLLAQLAHTAELFDYFRDGIYWLHAADLTAPQAIRNLALASECITSLDEEDQLGFSAVQQRWQTWLSLPQRVALVIFDGLADAALFEAVMKGAGPQVRGLVSTRDERVITSVQAQPLWQTEVQSIQLTALTLSEIETWLANNGLTLNPAQHEQLAALREQAQGRPDLIRTALTRLLSGEALAEWLPIDRTAASPTPRSDRRLRSSGVIERTAILGQIEAAYTRRPNRPIVLHGAPGSGKSTLLNWLTSDPVWQHRYPDGVRFLTQAESSPALIEIHGQPAALPAEHLIDRLQLHADQHLLLVLDNWREPDLALVLSRCVSSQSTLLVATRSSAVAAALGADDGLIAVNGYTAEEAADYFRHFCEIHQRAVTEADQAGFEQVCQLTRANPLGLRIALTTMLWRGWTGVLQQLQAVPPDSAGPAATDVYRPLRMAYDHLEPAVQRAVRELSALPLLKTYDRAAFVALWAWLDPAYVDLYLEVLTRDVGLLDASHPSAAGWEIHGSVLNFARSLTPGSNAVLAREMWIKRALSGEAHQTAYQQFQARSPKWTIKRLITANRAAPVPYRTSVWQRAWAIIRQPAAVSEWEVAQAFVPNLTASDYLIAHQLRAAEMRTHRIIQIAVLFSVALIVAGFPLLMASELNPWLAVDWLPRYILALLITLPLSLALLIYTWLVGMAHKMAWLHWWLQVQREEPPLEGTVERLDLPCD